MKKRISRILSAVLAFAMLATLAACGGSGSGTQTGGEQGGAQSGGKPAASGEKTKLQYVYRSEIVELPEEFNDVSRCFVAGGKLYLQGYHYGDMGSETVLVRAELDGSDPELVTLVEPPKRDEPVSTETGVIPEVQPRKKIGVATTAVPGGAVALPEPVEGEEEGDGELHTEEYRYLGALDVAPDGSFWFIENVSRTTYASPDDYEQYRYEDFTYLRHKSADGEDLLEFDVETLAEDPENPYIYVNSLVVDDAGNIILMANEQVLILDKDCKVLHRMDAPEGFNGFSTLMRSGDGTPIVGLYNEHYILSHLSTIDAAAGAFGEQFPLHEEGTQLSVNTYFDLFPALGSGIYLNDRQNIYSVDLATGKRTTVLNWLNSDIDINEISQVCATGEGTFMVCGYDQIDYKPQLMKLTEVPPDEIREKVILTLATTSFSYDTRRAVIQFNRANDLYRIQVKDYSVYDGIVSGTGENIEYDWDAGANRLNADIAAGDIPDILAVDERLPMDSYMAKGLFADLYPYLDADPDYSRELLCENVLRAMEHGGKLQTLTTHFNIYTIAGKTSVVGDGSDWTMAKMASLLSGRPADTQLFSEFTRENFLQTMLAMSIDNFVDPETGLCNFNSEDFIGLLELSAKFPEEISYDEDTDWDEYYERMELQYRKEYTLLMPTYLSDFGQFRRIEKGQFGDEVTLIGFPVSEGSGAALQLQNRYAISAKSKNGEGAWAFLRTFLSDEYYENSYYGLPIRKDWLEKKAAEATEPYTYEDENGNIIEQPNMYWIQDKEIDIGYPDQAEVDELLTYILSVDTLYRTDDKLMAIILDDAAAFYAGQKSARDVAGLIQSRAQIYISESR